MRGTYQKPCMMQNETEVTLPLATSGVISNNGIDGGGVDSGGNLNPDVKEVKWDFWGEE